MDIKEGHPGAVFHWFFDTNQGTDQPACMLMLLHGSSRAIVSLSKRCLERQSEFDDALGPEVLFLFFDPNVSPRKMSEHGAALKHCFQAREPAKFLLSGYGEAYPMPTGLIEVGRESFRSEKPGESYFEKIAGQVAACNSRAVPFFQQTFDLVPRQDYLLVAHRQQRTLQTFALGEVTSASAEDLLMLVRALRLIARRPKGAIDVEAIRTATTAQIDRGRIRSSAQLLWNTIRPAIRSLPH